MGAVCSGSTLFVSILNSSVDISQLFAADFSRRHFQMQFFRGALRVKSALTLLIPTENSQFQGLFEA